MNNLLVKDSLNYWREQLAGASGLLNLPTDHPRGSVSGGGFSGEMEHSRIDGGLTAKLGALGREAGVSLPAAVLSALAALLSRLTGKDEIVLGSSGQSDGPERFFPLRIDLSGGPGPREIMTRVEGVLEQCDGHRHLTSEQLGETVPLFQVFFTFRTAAVIKENIAAQSLGSDLGFFLKESGGGLDVTLTYNNKLFESSTVTKFMNRFRGLLEGMVSNPHETLSKLPFIMNDDERRQLLHRWNAAKYDYPREKRIEQLFRYHAERTPDAVAVVFEGHRLTYGLVNEKANQLAHYLRKKGVGPDAVVPILDRRTPGMLIAMLGIMKAGGAYLPIDMKNPVERILTMLDESGPRLVLSRDSILREKEIPYSRLLGLRKVTDQLIKTSPRPQITNLDGLPFPDRTLVDYKKYNRYIGAGCTMRRISLLATRGCPYKCAYCHNLWPKTHFIRSAENIFDEVRRHYDRGYVSFSFADDIFNLDMPNSRRFFELIIKNNLKVRLMFPSGMRADVLEPGYIDLMSEAGVVQLALALETASPRLQRLIRKFVRLDKFREMVDYLCGKHPNIILDLFIMHGFPSETEDEAMMTLQFIMDSQWIHFPYIFNLKVYPNTPMAQLAMEHGISKESIDKSSHYAYHDVGDIMPFSRAFSREYQTRFMKDYFLLPQRLQTVIPLQKQVFTGEELRARYNIYLPGGLEAYPEVEGLIGTEGFFSSAAVPQEERCTDTDAGPAAAVPAEDRLRILLIDLSQNYSHEADTLYEIVEAPLGLLYLQTYLNKNFGDRIQGKIIKSMIDFDNPGELETIVRDFQPALIGIRTLSFYKPLFHKTAALIKTWVPEVPIITGGPYATSEYDTVLADRNIDLVCLGEGEETFKELVAAALDNNGVLPGKDVLGGIAGLVFRSGTFRPGAFAREPVLLDRAAGEIGAESKQDPPTSGHSTGLAYVMFTSGSTGKPKGAMISHSNVLAFLYGFEDIAPTAPPFRGTTVCPFAFDVSVWEIFSALCFGGQIHILQPQLFGDPGQYARYMNTHRITNGYIPPALLDGVAAEFKRQGRPMTLNRIMVGVESIKQGTLQKFRDLSGGVRIVEPYGPTEATIGATMYKFEKARFPERRTPIGKVIANGYKVYIVDPALRPVPTGVIGEILIGGSGLGKGYINNLETTAHRFIRNPFSDNPGDRVYRTGDAGRILWDDNLEFIGRVDHQLKVRGFRIEPGEIETALEQHGDVANALVIAREDRPGDRRLVAYVVPGPNNFPSAVDLKDYLKKKLPEYMVPDAFVVMEKIPVTANGKPDRKGLPAPEASRGAEAGEYIPPRDTWELHLARIWEDILNVYPIGVRDNFFSLGGHSLLAVRIMAEVQEKFAKILPLTTLFNSSTIEGMAQTIREQSDTFSLSPLVPIQSDGHLRPFFCIHGVGGHVINLYHLAHHLGADRPFYGLQSRGLHGEAQPNECIEDMAALYLEAIKTVQPHGPYLVGGYSFGGRVAFEMARLIREQGETAALMAIIDYTSPVEEENLVGVDWDEIDWLAYTVNVMARLYDGEEISGEVLRGLGPDRQWEYIREWLTRADLLPPGMSKTQVHGLINVLKANIRAHYSPGDRIVYPGRITLLRTGEPPMETQNAAELADDATWGWGRFSSRPVDIHILPGNHRTMLEEPNVQALANRLRQCIGEVEAGLNGPSR